MSEGRLNSHILALCRVHGSLRVPVVPTCSLTDTGEDAVDGGCSWCENGRDHDRRAEEELTVCVCEGGFVGELPGEGAHDGAAGGVGQVKESVHVRQELETDVHCRLRCIDYAGPDVGFLWAGGERVMTSEKWHEGPK